MAPAWNRSGYVEALLRGLFCVKLGLHGFRIQLKRGKHIGDIGKSIEDGAAILRGTPVEHVIGGALLGPQCTAPEYGRGESGKDAPARIGAIEEIAELTGVVVEAAGNRELRKEVRRSDADLCARIMQQCFGGTDVRALLDEFGGQAERQIRGQLKIGKLEIGHLIFRRESAGQNRDGVARLLQLLLNGRQAGLCRGQLRLLGQHVAACDRAALELLIEEIEFLGLRGNDVLNRGNLGGERRFLNRRRNDVRGQGEIGRLELKARILLQRAGSFHGPLDLPEYVHQIGHADRGIEQIERCARGGRFADAPGAGAVDLGKNEPVCAR